MIPYIIQCFRNLEVHCLRSEIQLLPPSGKEHEKAFEKIDIIRIIRRAKKVSKRAKKSVTEKAQGVNNANLF